MQTSTHKHAHSPNKNYSQPQGLLCLRVPAELSVVGIVAGKWVAMQSESIGSTGLFLRAKEYVRPRSILELIIWIANDQAPLHMLATAVFIERTWHGYGISVQISAMPEEDQERWDDYLRTAAAVSSPGYSATTELGKRIESYHIMTIGYVLPAGVVDLLEQQGVWVETVRTPAQLLKQAQRGEGDLVVAALGGGTYDGLEICRQLAHQERAPLSVLITNRGVAQDFESGLYASASKVIARPCGYMMLAERLLDMLHKSRQCETDGESEDDLESGDFSLPPLHDSGAAITQVPRLIRQLAHQASLFWVRARIFFQSSALQRRSFFPAF